MMIDSFELQEYCYQVSTLEENQECYRRTIAFQKKWESFMSLQSYTPELLEEFYSDAAALEDFCSTVRTLEESEECLRRSLEFQAKWESIQSL